MSTRGVSGGSGRGFWAGRAVIVAAVLLVFGRLLACDFVFWDDEHTVYSNPKLNPAVTAESWVDVWTQPAASIYVPLTYTVWAALTFIARRPADAAGVTLDPMVYHAANVIVHAVGAIALFELLRRMLLETTPLTPGLRYSEDPGLRSTSDTGVRGQSSNADPDREDVKNHVLPALLGALLWALHPLQVESVAWVSGLKDVLSGTLVLVTLLAFVVYRQSARRRWLAVTVIAYALALLAKPAAMTGPLLVVLIDRFVLGTPWRRVGLGIVWFAVLTLPIAYIARLAQPAPASAASAGVRALLVGDTLAFYALKTVAPVSLAFDYGRDIETLRTGRELYVAWLLPAGVAIGTALIYARARRRGRPLSPLPAVGLGVFALAPLPVLGFTRFDFQTISTVADHYVYVALAGVAMPAAWAVTRWPRALGGLAVIIVVFGLRSAWQCGVWQDSETLFKHALTVTPRSWSSHVNLAALATRRQDAATAAHHLAAAEAIAPDQPSVHLALLADAARRGDREKAYDAARRLIAAYDATWTKAGYRPGEPYALIVKTFTDTGRLDAAAEFVREGLLRDPTEPRLLATARRMSR